MDNRAIRRPALVEVLSLAIRQRERYETLLGAI
jgi:hypothetical protein